MDYKKVTYNGKSYHVCTYTDEDEDVKLFVIDTNVFNEHIRKNVEYNEPYVIHDNRLARKYTNQEGRFRHYYVDRMVADRTIGITYIYHTNGLLQDLREENLCLVDADMNNESRNQPAVKSVPEGIRPSSVPKCVHYNSATNQFIIDFKCDGERHYIQLTTSNKLSIEGKLEDAKMTLVQFALDNPEVDAKKHLLENYSKNYINLLKSFNAILRLTDFDCIDESIARVPKRKILEINLDHLSNSDKAILKNMQITRGTGRNCTTKLPDKCTINISDLPKYCHYRPAKNGRSDSFYIRGYPYQGKEILSDGSTKMTTEQKYEQIMGELKILEAQAKKEAKKEAEAKAKEEAEAKAKAEVKSRPKLLRYTGK